MACCTLVESFAWTYCQDCGASWHGPDRKALATAHILGRQALEWNAEEQPEPTEDNVFKRLLREHPEGGGDPIRIERLKHFRLHVDTMSDDEVRQAAAAMTGYPVPTPREIAEEKVRVLLEWDAPTKALAWRMLKADGMSTARSDMLLRDAKWTLP